MGTSRRSLHILGMVLAYLVAFDLLGVVSCFVIDVMPLRRGGSMLLFTIWFVLGIFCGVLSYGGVAQSLSSKPDAVPDTIDARLGAQILGITAGLLLTLSLCFYRLWWRFNWFGGDYFVPDGGIPSVTFFVAILIGMGFSRHVFTPAPKKG